MTSRRRKRGNCAQVAAQIVMDEPDVMGGRPVVLAHGWPVGRGPENDGLRYWHAWVETADGFDVCDKSNGLDVMMPRDAYYALGSIIPEHVDRYTRDEVVDHILTDRTWGPW